MKKTITFFCIHFTRIFKNTTDLTPQEYRDAILKSKSLLNKKAD